MKKNSFNGNITDKDPQRLREDLSIICNLLENHGNRKGVNVMRKNRTTARWGAALLALSLLLPYAMPALAEGAPEDDIPPVYEEEQRSPFSEPGEPEPAGDPITVDGPEAEAVPGYAQVSLSWPQVEGAQSYAVYRGEHPEAPELLVEGLTDTAYLDAEAGTGVSHWYRVDAVLEDGTTAQGQEVQAGETGLEALRANAVVDYDLLDVTFDGTTTVDKTEDLEKLIRLTEGSVIAQVRYTGGNANVVAPFLSIGNQPASYVWSAAFGVQQYGGNMTARYELCDGLYSSAATFTPFSDGQWHTFVFTNSRGYVNVAVDGQSGGKSADGYYMDATKWNGFLSRTKDANTLTIGGMIGPTTNKNNVPYVNWTGDIAFLTVTDEVLMQEAANRLTSELEEPTKTRAHSITVPTFQGGAVSPDRAVAEAGETVTLTVTPSEGNVLKAGSLKAGEAELTKTGDTTYTFSMPDEAVTVTAVFEPAEAAPQRAVSGYARNVLTWQAAPGAVSYDVYGGEDKENLSPLAEGLTAPTYTHAGAGTGTHLWYRVDAVTGDGTVPGTPFRADLPTGIAAFQQSAIVHKIFAEGDQAFDGTRVVPLNEYLDRVKTLEAGSVLVQFRYNDTTLNGTTYSTLLGMGIQNGADGDQLGLYGVNSKNSIRFILANGMKTDSNDGIGLDDRQWHTAAFSSGAGNMFSAVDGTTNNGVYNNTEWPGFFNRVHNKATAVSLAIGGYTSAAPANFKNFKGDIAYVLISDEALTLAQAKELTRREQGIVPVAVKGHPPVAGVTGSLAATVTPGEDLAGIPGAVLRLTVPGAGNDNGKFALENGRVVTTEGLVAGQTYTIQVECGAATGKVTTYTQRVICRADPQPFYNGDGSGSQYFRIPGLLTLNNGDIMAAIDARFGGAGDSPNNLDTTVNFWRTGEADWEGATLPNHFVDFPDDGGYKGGSASFIDPQIVQMPADAEDHPNRILMVADAYPHGTGINSYTDKGIGGMIEVDGGHYLALTTGDRADFASYTHYLKPNPGGGETARYVVYTKAENTATDYTADGFFNLYENGEALTMAQSGTDVTVPKNLFYNNGTFSIFPTSYLWLTHSDDSGVSWSEPQLIGNEYRTAKNGNFLGAGPGRGFVVPEGAYKGRVMFCVYDEGVNDAGTGNRNERASVVYSDDGGDTWLLGERTTMAASNSPGKSSEAQIVALPDGTLRLFARGSAGFVGYGDSTDGGVTWSPMVQDKGLAYVGNCQISVINYSQPIEGRPALLLSSPEGPGRVNGIIRVGLIGEDNTIHWKYRFEVNTGGLRYIYSCLTELPDGTIGLLYEHDVDSNIPGVNPVYITYTLDQIMGLSGNAITAQPGTGGTLALSRPKADPGTTITVTPVPRAGYTYVEGSLSVTYGTETVPVTPGIGGTFTFVMPDEPVNVTARFAEVQAEITSVTARYQSNRLIWQGSADGVKHELQRGALANGDFTTLVTLASAAPFQYVDETAGTGTRWWYRLAITGAEGGVRYTEAVQASAATGLDALLEDAVVSKLFTDDKQFDGSRVEVLTEDPAVLGALRALDSGTILYKIKYTGTSLAQNATVSVLGSNLNDYFFGLRGYNGTKLRIGLGGSFGAREGTVNLNASRYYTGLYAFDDAKDYYWLSTDGQVTSGPWTQRGFFNLADQSLTALTVGGTKGGAQAFTGSIAYVLVSGEILSEAEIKAVTAVNAFPASDTHPDLGLGENLAQMFNNAPDNTWVFTGGRDAQGSFADIAGARGYTGHFEEYIRWQNASVSGSAGQIARQRHVTSTAKAGQSLGDVVASFDSVVAPFSPKAVAYLVGREDWSAGAAGLEDFKAELTALLSKTLALRGGTGLAVVQTPHAVADLSDNASAALYAQAVTEVVTGLTPQQRASVAVVDHFTATDNDGFKSVGLTAEGYLSAKGNLELGRQLAKAVYGSDANYPNSNLPVSDLFPSDLTALPAPERYSGQAPTVAAGRDSLTVTIPAAVSGEAWTYALETSGYTLSAAVTGRSFVIADLTPGDGYTLTVTAADGSLQLAALPGP